MPIASWSDKRDETLTSARQWLADIVESTRPKWSDAMIKILLAAVLSLTVVGAAQAETLTLSETGGFGALKQFYNVNNDAGKTINLILSTTYTSIYMTIDGVTCSAPTGNGNPIVNATLSCDDGGWAILNVTFITHRHYVGSGRGQHWVTTWTLNGGTIERP
jgi:hypothetical protein